MIVLIVCKVYATDVYIESSKILILLPGSDLMLEYLKWLKKIDVEYTTDNKEVSVFEFDHTVDDKILDEWANHFRNQYCSDVDIDDEREGTGLSRSEFLVQIKFPTKTGPPGPSIRAGDFSEILVSDFIQFALNYYVPRTRYDAKIIRNESTKGCDIIAFKKSHQSFYKDEMLIVEVKAQLSGTTPTNRLQDAIDDSGKDVTRLAESLNAMKQRLKQRNERENAAIVQRFQNSTDTTYKRTLGAAVVQATSLYSTSLINSATTENHPDNNMKLIYIKGKDLMTLVHELYKRASIC
jgi:hypothetical protein